MPSSLAKKTPSFIPPISRKIAWSSTSSTKFSRGEFNNLNDLKNIQSNLVLEVKLQAKRYYIFHFDSGTFFPFEIQRCRYDQGRGGFLQDKAHVWFDMLKNYREKCGHGTSSTSSIFKEFFIATMERKCAKGCMT